MGGGDLGGSAQGPKGGGRRKLIGIGLAESSESAHQSALRSPDLRKAPGRKGPGPAPDRLGTSNSCFVSFRSAGSTDVQVRGQICGDTPFGPRAHLPDPTSTRCIQCVRSAPGGLDESPPEGTLLEVLFDDGVWHRCEVNVCRGPVAEVTYLSAALSLPKKAGYGGGALSRVAMRASVGGGSE